MEEIRKKAEYRSSLRSKTMIRNAYLSLLAECSDGKISVSDIIVRADITRATFYAHFASPDEVAEAILDTLLSKAVALFTCQNALSSLSGTEALLMRVNAELLRDRKYYQQLIALPGGQHYLHTLKETLISHFSSDSLLERVVDKEDFLLSLSLIVSGGVDLYAKAVVSDRDQMLGALPQFFAATVRTMLLPYIARK